LHALLTPHSIVQRLALDEAARRDAYLGLFKEPLDPASSAHQIEYEQGWRSARRIHSRCRGAWPKRAASEARAPSQAAGRRGQAPAAQEMLI